MKISTKNKIRLASIINKPFIWFVFLLIGSKIQSVKRNGLLWKLDLNEGIDFSIYLFGFFERTTSKALKRLVSKNSIVIDIGANIGAHTLPMANLLSNEGKIYALEPTKFAYSKLKDNIKLNAKLSKQIQADQVMLINTNSQKETNNLYSSWPLKKQKKQKTHNVHLGALMTTDGSEKLSLDQYISFQKIKKIDLIKIDVDGNELEVFTGAMNTLNQFKPTLIMELAPSSYDEPSDFDKTIVLLSEIGYVFYSLNEKIKLSTNVNELKKIISKSGSINVIARIINEIR